MDDLIVIILTIIIVVAGAIGQIKKKPVQDAKVKDNEPRDDDDIWLLPGETKTVETEGQTVRNSIDEQKEVKMADNLQSYKFKDDYTTLSSKPDKKSEFEKIAATQVKKNKFPLRKAVIFSEILNRKYI